MVSEKFNSNYSAYTFNPYCFPQEVDVSHTIALFEAKQAARKGIYERYINIPTDQVISLSKRVTWTALSVLVIYQPQIIFPIIGASYCVSFISKVDLKSDWSEISISLLHVALSVSALTIGFFDYKLGNAIAQTQIIIVSIKPLLSAIDRRDTKAILEITANIISSMLYIASFATGTLELLVLYQLSLILIKAYSSFDEFAVKDRYIEGVGFLLVAILRSNRIVPKLEELIDKYQIEVPGR